MAPGWGRTVFRAPQDFLPQVAIFQLRTPPPSVLALRSRRSLRHLPPCSPCTPSWSQLEDDRPPFHCNPSTWRQTQEDGQGSRPEKDNKSGYVPPVLTHPSVAPFYQGIYPSSSPQPSCEASCELTPPAILPGPRAFAQAALIVSV